MQPISQQLAKELRHNPTWAERKLWSRLRGGRLCGFKFRRQHPLGRYVLDFYCASGKLAVEVDGDPHGIPPQHDHDSGRDEFMEALGIKTMRFWNEDVRTNLEGVLESILMEMARRTKADPSP